MSSGIFVRELIESLQRENVENDVHVIRGREAAWRYGTAPLAVAWRQVRGRYDLVHAHYGLSAAVVAGWPIPLVVTYHGSDLNIPWQRVISRWAGRRAAARIVVSRKLSERLGLPGTDVIPCGVDTGVFRIGDRQQARASLGWDPEKPYVLFPGDPRQAVKNHDLFRATMSRLEATGRSPEEVKLDGSVARELVPIVMIASDVMLLTSHTEGSPQVVKEALAAGLPIVSTDVGDVAEVTETVSPGGICPPDADALARAVSRVLEHPCRSDGPQRIRALGLEWGQIARRVRMVYDRVISRANAA